MVYILIFIALLAILTGAYFYWLHVPSPARYRYKGELSKKAFAQGNLERTYLVYTPIHAPSTKLPVVIVLHGTGINGGKIRAWTGYDFDRLADRHGFRVVYPDAVNGHWNDLRNGEGFKSKKENIDDVGFIKSIVDHFQGEQSPGVFAFGYSNGGVMLYRLMAEHPDLFEAVAVAGANLPAKPGRLKEALQPVPRLMLVSGSKDPIMPYEGGTVKLFGRNLGQVISAKETAEYYAATHGALWQDVDNRPDNLFADYGTRLCSENWHSGGETKVILYIIENGGHVIPSAHAVFPRLMGIVSRRFDAVQSSINFFGLKSSDIQAFK